MNVKQGRPLGSRERFLWLLDQQRPVHFTMAAEITGRYAPDQWLQALATVQAQHPLLSAAIHINSNKAPEFVLQPGHTIQFKIVKLSIANDWIAQLEQDAAQRFNSTCAPLLRAAVYESDKVSIIALTAHHAISDGRSLSFLLRDLLDAMNGKTGQIYSMPPSLDFYTEGSYNSANEVPVTNQLIDNFKQQPPQAWPKPQFQVLALTKELTSRIIERSKQEGTSVHGALSAALVWVSKSLQYSPIRIYSPVSIRETVGAGETTCVSITGRTVSFDAITNSSFWDTARYAKQELNGANSLAFLTAFNQALLEMLPTVRNSEDVDHFINTKLAHEFLLSNLGALPFNSDYGQMKLRGVWGPFLLPGSEDIQSLGVATINGSIHLTLTSLGNTEAKPILNLLENVLHEQFPLKDTDGRCLRL
jgi:hypothetical protein